VARLEPRPCRTETIKIHGYDTQKQTDHWAVYGSDSPRIRALCETDSKLAEKLHPDFDHIGAEVVWAVRHEMARTVEDVLARRLRILFLDVAKSREMAPKVATLMAEQLGKDGGWIATQLNRYADLTTGYLPHTEGETA